jgi:hypothetical protein
LVLGPEAVDPCKIAAEHSKILADRALVLIPVAGPLVVALTYWLGYRHKEKDRRFDIYKQSVIIPSLDDLDKFFTKYREKFVEYARNPAANSGGMAVPRASTKLYREFSSDLYAIKDAIVGRVEIYDKKTVGRLEDIVGSFDTKVTQKLISRLAREEQTINEILLNAKRETIRTIYKCNLGMLK